MAMNFTNVFPITNAPMYTKVNLHLSQKNNHPMSFDCTITNFHISLTSFKTCLCLNIATTNCLKTLSI